MEVRWKEYFCVNAGKYDPTFNFNVVRPASLIYPKNNAVMFLTMPYSNMAGVFYEVNECLIFWPKDLDIPSELKKKHVFIVCDNPHTEYCKFFKEHHITNLPPKEEMKYIDGAWISKRALIGERVTIMNGVYIGGESIVGDDTYIGCGTKIVGDVYIGKRVIIRENTVIGADSLTTDRDIDGIAITMPQFGGVVIEDDVQIGANVTIGRGAIDNTIIHKRAKISNSVYISHNVEIGNDTFILGESILFGSSSIGSYSMVSGNSTIRNGIQVGNQCLIGMGSVVLQSVPNGTIVKGNPAK